MQWIFALLIFALFSAPVQAQYVVRVDSSLTRNLDKNLGLALLYSTALPGMGELYLGEKDRIKPHVWTEILGWGAVAVSWFAGESYLRSAQGYVEQHAGVVGPPKDPVFLDLMARYRSRAGVHGQNSSADLIEDYNLALIRSGRDVDEEYPFDPAHTWDWGSSENPDNTQHMDEYSNILTNYRIAKISFQVAVGVVVLNRLVSMLDVVRIHRATTAKDLAFGFTPILAPQVAGADFYLTF